MYAQYELEVLTPLAVGSGRKVLPMEYVATGRELVRVDMDKFFHDRRFSPEVFVRQADTGQLYLGREYPFAASYPLYTLNGEAASLTDLAGRPHEILEFVRESAGWIVPGSSLKGALRTATLKANLTEQQKSVWAAKIEETFNNIQDNKRKKEEAATKAEQTVSGQPNYSAFRALKIGDSQPAGQEAMAIYSVRVLSLRQNGYGWKQLPRNTVDEPRQATVIFFEAMRPGTRLAGRMTLDRLLLGSRQINLTGQNIFNDWLQRLREAGKEHLAAEKDFYQRINMKSLVEEYARLEKIAATLAENQVILPLGWGSGYTVKTLRGAMPEDKFRQLAAGYGLQLRPGFPFPKTRKIVFANGTPATVCGFVKLTLKED